MSTPATNMTYTIDQLNQMSQDEFVAALGAVFEETPAIARQAWQLRPFENWEDLYRKMISVMYSLSPDQQLALIRSHPDLGSRAKMAEASVKEQIGAGLNQLTAEEYNQIQTLNQTYRDKFGFPYIVAVKNHTKSSILDNFQNRLQNEVEAEQEQALKEIATIVQFRLHGLVTSI